MSEEKLGTAFEASEEELKRKFKGIGVFDLENTKLSPAELKAILDELLNTGKELDPKEVKP